MTNWVKLKFAAMNLKKMLATWKWKECLSLGFPVPPVKCTRNPVSAAGFSRQTDRRPDIRSSYFSNSIFRSQSAFMPGTVPLAVLPELMGIEKHG